MSDPRLSEHTNRLVTEEVRDVIGESYVEVPVDRPHVSGGFGAGTKGVDSRGAFNFTDNRMLICTIGFAALVVGLIAALSTGHWWLVPVAFVVLLLLVWAMAHVVFSMTSTREHLAPTTAAAMQEEGIADPDGFFSDAVAEYTEPTDDSSGEHRTTTAQESPGQAAAEQQAAGTPTSGKSRAVGP